MKLISWNVNGLRACIKKGFQDFFDKEAPDILCLQEIKMLEDEADINAPGYHKYFNSAEKKGYSGTAVFSKYKPISVSYDMGIDEHDHEGRIITLEYDKFILINVYAPNSRDKLVRLDYRMRFEDDFRDFIKKKSYIKSIILCGDLNVAHAEIDLKNPRTNRKNPGFTDEERQKLTKLLDECSLLDSFRLLHPDMMGAYTWWSYRGRARENNSGWRIDYFLCLKNLKNQINGSIIYKDILGSDHCPIGLLIDMN